MANYFQLSNGVRVAGNQPIDGDRYVAIDKASRDNLITIGRAFEGLQVYIESGDTANTGLWILEKLGADIASSTWTAVGSGTSNFDPTILNPQSGATIVYSAGTKAEGKVNPNAIKVMQEMGIDLSQNKPDSVEKYLNKQFDFVITVCGGAKESCPNFTGKVKHNLHIGFEDPADARGTNEEILQEFRAIRNEIKRDFYAFYLDKVKA